MKFPYRARSGTSVEPSAHGATMAPPRRASGPSFGFGPMPGQMPDDLLALWAALDRGPGGRGVLAILPDHLDALEEAEGAAAAAELLAAVEERLLAVVRGSDRLVRWQGRGFLLLAGEVLAVRDLEQLAGRLLDVLALAVSTGGARRCLVSASIGIAPQFDGPGGLDHLIGSALGAARRVGEQGGGAAELAVAAPSGRSRWERLQAVRRAVVNDELDVHYQPMVELATGRRRAFEALVRWRDPIRGLLYPSSFLDDVRRNGLEEDLTETVLHHAAARSASHTRTGDPQPVPVGVNLDRWRSSPESLVTMLAAVTAEHGLASGSIVLEVPERRLLVDPALCDVVRLVVASGAAVAIDGGMGEVDELDQVVNTADLGWYKLDRCWMAQHLSAAVGPFVGELARRLPGVPLVGLGVADTPAAERAASAGLDWGQGFALGRPEADPLHSAGAPASDER